MQNTRFHSIATRFTPMGLRTSFRRSSTASSRASSRNSFASNSSSPTETINSIIHRQPSIVNLEAEKRSFRSELDLLEPRPIVYWGGMEERMGSF
jgi:hypothetical protein